MNDLIQRQIAAETLKVSLASYLSQLNGRTVDENIRDAIQTSLVTSFSVTEVLELAINQHKLLDRFAVSVYNTLDIKEEEKKDMEFTIDNSSEIQIELFRIAELVMNQTNPGLVGWDRFNKRFDIFQFLMRDPESSTTATIDDLVAEYNDFFGSQFDGQTW